MSQTGINLRRLLESSGIEPTIRDPGKNRYVPQEPVLSGFFHDLARVVYCCIASNPRLSVTCSHELCRGQAEW